MVEPSNPGRKLKRILANDYFPILALIVINIIIGALIFADYGESWDEQLRYQYGERSLAAYSGAGKNLIDEKGAFYVMLAKLGSDALRKLNGDLQPIQAWHLIHFLTFVLGLFFLYRVCLKFTGKWAAFGTALLFNTQPLLWGHAFINPKDIPFMVFFLGSVAFGMEMVDGAADTNTEAPPTQGRLHTEIRAQIKSDWGRLSRNRQRLTLAVCGTAAGVLLLPILFASPLRKLIDTTIRSAYDPSASTVLARLFSRLAENRAGIPVDFYVQKADALFTRFTVFYFGWLVILLFLVAVWSLPSASRLAWRSGILPLLGRVWRSLLEPRVWAAGIFLGLCTSIRVLGPASALLVSLYFFLKARLRAIPPLIAYITIAILVTYLTWPYLWGSPLRNFLHSLTIASDFPWEGKLLFAGVEYPVGSLPRAYLPVLLVIQTPELTLALFLVGLAGAVLQVRSKRLDWRKVMIAALWFFTPILAVVILNPTMYDNFRQFLFILPAAFVFIAIGFGWIFHRLRSPAWRSLIILIVVLPNIYWLLNLHPYQYIYYNQFVGGVQGAFRRYETDYWATSYPEASRFLNAVAPAQSTILVVGPSHIVRHAARPDLTIQDYSAKNQAALDQDHPLYAVIYTRYNKDQSLFPDAPEIFRVIRDGATLAVVKQISP